MSSTISMLSESSGNEIIAVNASLSSKTESSMIGTCTVCIIEELEKVKTEETLV